MPTKKRIKTIFAKSGKRALKPFRTHAWYVNSLLPQPHHHHDHFHYPLRQSHCKGVCARALWVLPSMLFALFASIVFWLWFELLVVVLIAAAVVVAVKTFDLLCFFFHSMLLFSFCRCYGVIFLTMAQKFTVGANKGLAHGCHCVRLASASLVSVRLFARSYALSAPVAQFHQQWL